MQALSFKTTRYESQILNSMAKHTQLDNNITQAAYSTGHESLNPWQPETQSQ